LNVTPMTRLTATRAGRRHAWAATILLSAGALIAAAGPAFAHAADGHPAKIHEGTCEALGPVAYSLTGVGATVDLDENPIATPEPVNAENANEVETSVTTIDAPLDKILSGDHAIMLYEDDESMQAIACGNVGGAMLGNTLVVGLGEEGMPGHVGFALLAPNGDKTDVTILLGEDLAPLSAGAAATPEGEEAGHAQMATPAA
jgi:hypothetical protein